MGSIALVLGTRPEIIKLAAIIGGLGDRASVVHSGQHYDHDMSQAFFDSLGLAAPSHQLALGSLSRADLIGQGTAQLADIFAAVEPDAVVVQGDTTTALAGALAANSTGLPLVHVEAGLRSYDRAMPEEHNRVLIDHIADLLAAPTPTSVDNLAREGITGDSVICVGNTAIEAVQAQLPSRAVQRAILERFGVRPDTYVVATIHRPENTDDPAILARILRELADLPLPVVLPLHPRTAAAAAAAGLAGELAKLQVVAPIDGPDFLALATSAAVLVSDSGGVQEEVTVLGRPLVVVRRSTERPEALEDFAVLVAPDAIGSSVRTFLAGGRALLAHLAATPSPFGDGTASKRIVEEVLTRFGE